MIHIIMAVIVLNEGLLVKELRFDEYNLRLEQAGDLTRARFQGLDITDEIGAPELPVKRVSVALPLGAIVQEVKIIAQKSCELEGEFLLSFSQPPAILSLDNVKRITAASADIYSSDRPYPAEVVEYKGTGFCDNYQVCELLVHPLQYKPKSKKLLFYSSLKIAVLYKGGIQLPAKTGIIKNIAINPEDIFSDSRLPEREKFRYLIITNPPMDTVFQRLAAWKTKKGFVSRVRTKGWIIAHYPGEDDAAKIRNYLKTLPDSSVEYVLLGGDTDIIPCRFAYAMTCSAGFYPGREDTMPCDLYYADLQGDWDLDNDGSYGEIEDSIDLYPDLFVGRAPVNTVEEAQRFVDKVLNYERNPTPDYLDNALFTAEILWSNPYTDQGVHKNQIGDESFPGYFGITKLYQSLGNETKASVMAAIRAGQGLINHDGHGWIDLISVGGWPERIYIADFDTITNAPRFGILYSIGCWTAAFDSASVSEAYVNSPNGGGVAYIGNSSYGWGSPGNPGFGYSDRFDSRFFFSLFNENHFNLGDALSLAKAHFIPFSREKNVYRWHQYEINLLGDPELPVWTASPESLLVLYPQLIPLGSCQILITVRNKGTGAPVRGALVCLMKNVESYACGYTDASGLVYLDATPVTSGDFDLTVSAHNYFCVENTIQVTSGAYVNFQGWVINDMFGNSDSIANPDENILLPTKIKNCGNATASNIQLTLHSSDPMVTLLDSTAFVSTLNAGDSMILDNAFGITVGDVQNGHGIAFDLTLNHNSQTLNFYPIVLIGTPILKIDKTVISSPSMPGETESLYVDIRNSGFGFGHSTWAQLSSNDPYVSVNTNGSWYGEIDPESLKAAAQPFIVSISPGCPGSYLAHLPLAIHSDNYIFDDTVDLLIGQTGFTDDMESGSALWTSGGINNLWHLSARKALSPTHSWYCGDEANGIYVDNMSCYIQTIPFMVSSNSLLKFFRWFSVPLYGSDGIYVIIMGNGFADTLDFIGTGGALDERGIQSDWFEEKYALSEYPAGETIQVRIAFVSDSDSNVGEGFYVDNFNIEYITSIAEQNLAAVPDIHLRVYPNPARNRVVIAYGIGHGTEGTELKIFDASGRLVKSFKQLLNGQLRSNQVTWDGSDEIGKKVPAGVYFVGIECDDNKEIEKVILLR